MRVIYVYIILIENKVTIYLNSIVSPSSRIDDSCSAKLSHLRAMNQRTTHFGIDPF